MHLDKATQSPCAQLAHIPLNRNGQFKLTRPQKAMKQQELCEALLSKQPAQEPDTLHCWKHLTYFTTTVPQQGYQGPMFSPGITTLHALVTRVKQGLGSTPEVVAKGLYVLDTQVKSIGKCLTLLPELRNIRRQQASDKNPGHFCSSKLAFHSYSLFTHIQA